MTKVSNEIIKNTVYPNIHVYNSFTFIINKKYSGIRMLWRSSIKKLSYILIILCFVACSENEPLKTDILSSKHTYGEVYRNDTDSVRPKNSGCSRYKHESIISKTVFPKLYERSFKVLKQLISSNKDFLSRSGYDKDSLCISIYKSKSINAHVSPGSDRDGIIYLSTSFIKAAKTDSDLASIISHELAHLTMNHHGDQIPNLKELEKDPTYIKHYKNLKKVIINIEEQKNVLRELIKVNKEKALTPLLYYVLDQKRYALTLPLHRAINFYSKEDLELFFTDNLELYKSYNSYAKETNFLSFKLRHSEYRLLKKLGRHKGKNYFYAWKEIEADEVGQEFFARSGYDLSSFNWIHSLVDDESFCNKDFDKREIPMVDETHPASCWRTQNNKQEQQIHKDEYDQ